MACVCHLLFNLWIYSCVAVSNWFVISEVLPCFGFVMSWVCSSSCLLCLWVWIFCNCQVLELSVLELSVYDHFSNGKVFIKRKYFLVGKEKDLSC